MPTRRVHLLIIVLGLLSAAIAVALAFSPIAANAKDARVEKMVIETGSGRHSFATEIADTEPLRARGLMDRRHLAGDHAMLFVWEGPTEASMWMKDTYIPLDMLFVGADGHIVHIVANTKPESLDIISAGKPVRAVIELAGGTVARLGIRLGDVVHYKLFGG